MPGNRQAHVHEAGGNIGSTQIALFLEWETVGVLSLCTVQHMAFNP